MNTNAASKANLDGGLNKAYKGIAIALAISARKVGKEDSDYQQRVRFAES